jgi:hypothetical protein
MLVSYAFNEDTFRMEKIYNCKSNFDEARARETQTNAVKIVRIY